MTAQERALVLDLALRRISDVDFLSRFPVNPKSDPSYIENELETALRQTDANDVEVAMLLGFHFGFHRGVVDVLCKLVLADWHTQHENIAMALQRLRDPRSVDCLFQAANASFPYLDYDESHALAVKCIWALGEIQADSAKEKLSLLAESDNAIIRENAQHQLARWKN